VWFVWFVDNLFRVFRGSKDAPPAGGASNDYANQIIIRVRTGPLRAWLQRDSTSPV
jgi:hypothetical protein